MPDPTVSGDIANGASSRYFINLCGPDGKPAIQFILASTTAGRTYPTLGSASDLFVVPIPVALNPAIMAPEVAIRMVAESLGARVAAVPVLVEDIIAYGPEIAGRDNGIRWKVTLDRTVRVQRQTSGTTDTTSVVYVEASRANATIPNVPVSQQLQLPRRDQLGPIYFITARDGMNQPTDSVEVLPIAPVAFEVITKASP